MKYTPIGDRVLIRELEAADRTAGGLHIPDPARQRPTKGKILAAGRECTLKPGDLVAYGKWAGYEVSIEGETLLIIKESEVLARIK